jgi:chromosome segregation ATPase
MGDNQPAGNAYLPPDSALQDCSMVLSNLARDTNGNDSAIQRALDKERARRESAETKLADASVKFAQLFELKEKCNLKLASAQTDLKYLSGVSKAAKASAKQSLDGQKAQNKKDFEGQKAHATIQLDAKKDALKAANSSKATLKKEFDKFKKKYDSLFRSNETNKGKLSEVNMSQSVLLRTRTNLQAEVKDLQKDLKAAKKKLDAQLINKLEHEMSMQQLKNDYKQLDIDQARERFENKKNPAINKKTSLALSLDDKKELESHKVECRSRSKDDDAARDKLKKDLKQRKVQSNLGFAANMLQNSSNVNGGMWQQGTIQDVSCSTCC